MGSEGVGWWCWVVVVVVEGRRGVKGGGDKAPGWRGEYKGGGVKGGGERSRVEQRRQGQRDEARVEGEG